MPTINSGNGTAAGVTSDRRLMIESISRAYGTAVCMDYSKAFSFADDTVTPTGAADVFARIGVEGTNESLIVTWIEVQCAAADVISVQLVANYTSVTSFADKVARNRNAGAQATTLWTTYGLFQSDVDIEGDAGAVTTQIAQLAMPTLGTKYTLDLRSQPIVVPTGYSLILEATTGTAAISYSVFGHLAAVPYEDA